MNMTSMTQYKFNYPSLKAVGLQLKFRVNLKIDFFSQKNAFNITKLEPVTSVVVSTLVQVF